MSSFPSVNSAKSPDTFCFTFRFPTFKAKQHTGQPKSSQTSLPFPSSTMNSTGQTGSELFLISPRIIQPASCTPSFLCAQLPVRLLSIMYDQSGQWRRRIKLRSCSSGVLPIVLLLTWSMWRCVCLPPLAIKANRTPVYHFHKEWIWQALKGECRSACVHEELLFRKILPLLLWFHHQTLSLSTKCI